MARVANLVANGAGSMSLKPALSQHEFILALSRHELIGFVCVFLVVRLELVG